MADEKKDEKVSAGNETEAYMAERRAVTKAGQDEAMDAAAKGKETPETKKPEPDPGLKAVLEEIKGLREDNRKIHNFNEELKKDNFKLREKMRQAKSEEAEDTEDEKDPDADFEKAFTKFEKKFMERIGPMVQTVRKLDFGSQIAAIAAGNRDVAEAINSLPAEIQANLADRVDKLASGMRNEGDDPTVATVDAIFYLAHRHGRQPSEGGVTLPDTKGAADFGSEDEDRKINRALFGEHLVPKKRAPY